MHPLLHFKPPKSAHTQKLTDGTELYYYHKPPETIHTFEDAQNPLLWRSYYKPFACMFVSQNQHDILLVRDHLGLSPLYYYHVAGKPLVIGETLPDVLNQLPSTPSFCENQVIALFSENKSYSDETIYQNIYRVEPGHFMRFSSDGTALKTPFWQLEAFGPTLHYADDRDYLEHFTSLMAEAMDNALDEPGKIAAEYSAGLDSSAVYCAATAKGIQPTLFMHVETPGRDSKMKYNDHYEKAFIEQYQLHDIQRIGAENFDPIAVFKNHADWFGGPAPYLFFMFAYNLHRAVALGQHRILLSGFGGDQGVSGQIPLNFYLPEFIHQKGHRKAWHEFTHHQAPMSTYMRLKRGVQYTPFMHPALYHLSLNIKHLRHVMETRLKSGHPALPAGATHPYQRHYFHTLREAEWSLLQGPESHEVRMRIEYSSIVGKKMGFEYRYPLLYPKLLEFILSVPVTQKRREGQGRYLIKQYLSQFPHKDLFQSYRKQEGLGIVPSTFGLFQQKFEEGYYQPLFQDLPYSHLIRDRRPSIEIRNKIKGFMLKTKTQTGAYEG